MKIYVYKSRDGLFPSSALISSLPFSEGLPLKTGPTLVFGLDTLPFIISSLVTHGDIVSSLFLLRGHRRGDLLFPLVPMIDQVNTDTK